MAIENEIEIFRGTDRVLRFTVATSESEASVSAWSVDWKIKPYRRTQEELNALAALMTKTTGGGGITYAGNKQFDVALAIADTSALLLALYSHQLSRTNSGAVDALSWGSFKLLNNLRL